MPSLSSLRPFCSTPSLLLQLRLSPKFPPFRISAASSSPGRGPRKPSLPSRRRFSTLGVPKPAEKPPPAMEESTGDKVGFNKRRAEGREKSDKPKTLQLKTRKLNPVNTICYVQILGTGMDTQDTCPSVLLFFDKQRFIFNAGEGLQRFCTEHKIKLSKIDHIFLSRVCSETAGGLPGLLLTLAGMGEEGMSVNVWGPSDLKYLIEAMTFIPNAAMVHTHKFGLSSDDKSPNSWPDTEPIVLVDDEVVKLSAILLWPRYFNLSDPKNLETECSGNGSFPLSPCSQSSREKVGTMPKAGDISVIYACELPEIKGKFDPAKAVALGLKPGPKYRELQLGNSVMSDQQKVMVHPSDVLGPSIPGPIVLLVDCPTLAHLQEMLSLNSLHEYYIDGDSRTREGSKSVNCIIHLGPASVTSAAEYQIWMKRFGVAQHIMAGHTMKNMEIPILKSSAKIASRLNFLCPELFPAPGVWCNQSVNKSMVDTQPISKGSSDVSESLAAENLLKFHLRPYSQLGLDKSAIPSGLNLSEMVTELLSEIPEIEEACNRISQFWHSSKSTDRTMSSFNENALMVEEPWMNEGACASAPQNSGPGSVEFDSHVPNCLENISRDDMEIVLLGTGSSQPSKYRNVSSIYINLFSKGSLLLDCGEGTLAQLKRRFGVEGADEAIRGLKCIWISHIHADHHAGLARILSVRVKLLTDVPHEPLLVVGPRQLKRFLDAYSRLEDIDMQFLDCRDTVEASWEAASRGDLPQVETSLFSKSSRMESYWKRPGSPPLVDFPTLKRLKRVLLEAGLEALISVPVIHCPQAFGVVLKATERVNVAGKTIPGWKLVYSGDTRPCQALIDASCDATVIIHEATFEDGMMEEAIARNHSTTGEAIEVGSSAGVYRIVLTHFSQRYPKVPVFDETHMHKTCIAFDMMSINVADLPILPKVVPYLKLLFKNEMVADDADDVPLLLMGESS